MIKIDHGTEIARGANVPQGFLKYHYRYHDSAGYHVLEFITDLKPEIGDFIDNGILVKRIGLQINQDKRMWENKLQVDTWGR